MKSIETTIKSVEKSIQGSEVWITKVETLLAKRLIRLRDMGRLHISPKNN